MKKIIVTLALVLSSFTMVHSFSFPRIPIGQQVEDIPQPSDEFAIGLDEAKGKPQFVETDFGKQFSRCIYFSDDQIVSCTDKDGKGHKFNVHVQTGNKPSGKGFKVFGYYHDVQEVTGKQLAQKNWVYSIEYKK